MIYIFIYIAMCIFDFAILAGTAYLVQIGWTPHWFWLAFLMCLGSYPGSFLKFIKETERE